MFAGHLGFEMDFTMQGKARQRRKMDRFPVEYRQSAGHPDANRAAVGIGRLPKADRASAKYFGLGIQLYMGL